MLDKLEVEKQLEREGGDVDSGLDVIWQQKDVAVKEKVDAYGYLLADIDAQETGLKSLQEKIQAAKQRLSNLRNRLKVRLHTFAGGEPLRGNVYNFLPYVSEHRIISDPDKLSPSESYLTIEIRKDQWIKLLDAYQSAEGYAIESVNGEPIETDVHESGLVYSIRSVTGKVSELPSGHPAVTEIKEPSVRIT